MIRAAELKDRYAMADLLISAWHTAYTGLIDPEYPSTMKAERYIRIFHENISLQREHVFVHEENGAVLGFVSGKILEGERMGEIIGLYVHPDHQGMGIGSGLFGQMAALFQKRGIKSIMVRTLLKAKNNLFYEMRGGSVSGSTEIEIGGTLYPGVCFIFTLQHEN